MVPETKPNVDCADARGPMSMARQQQSPRARITRECPNDFVMVLFPPPKKTCRPNNRIPVDCSGLSLMERNFCGESQLDGQDHHGKTYDVPPAKLISNGFPYRYSPS